MDKKSIDKEFISPIDRFIHEYNSSHPFSESQLKENRKHMRIFKMRDNVDAHDGQEGIWQDFEDF